MRSVVDTIDTRPCYFTITPPAHDHFSAETPVYSPTYSPPESSSASSHPANPLLASRLGSPAQSPPSPTTPAIMASSFMQAQTSAAYGHAASRPRPHPIQNVLHVTSDDDSHSSSSASPSSSASGSPPTGSGMISPPETARCSRCQRTPSLDLRTGNSSNMIQYGLNLWYCNRCAAMVGLVNR